MAPVSTPLVAALMRTALVCALWAALALQPTLATAAPSDTLLPLVGKPRLTAADFAAVRALGPTGLSELAAIYERSDDDEQKTRIARIFYGLGIESSDAKRVLMRDIHTQQRELRLEVQWALSRVSADDDVVDALVENMRHDANPVFRDKAACSLADDQIHLDADQKQRLLSKMVESLSSPNAETRSLAIQVIEHHTGQSGPRGFNAHGSEQERALVITRWQHWLTERSAPTQSASTAVGGQVDTTTVFDVSSVPNPRLSHNGWVTDAAGVLGAANTQLEAVLDALNRETGAELALVILPSIGQRVPKVFATDLFNAWHIGRVGHDDGVLVLHVLDQRRVEIETGYGVEGALTDLKCARLLREVALPRFKAGDFAAGHLGLARALSRGIREPNASYDDLVGTGLDATAAVGGQPLTLLRLNSSSRGVQPSWASFVESLSFPFHAPLVLLLLLNFGVWPARLRAHRALYRNPNVVGPSLQQYLFFVMFAAALAVLAAVTHATGMYVLALIVLCIVFGVYATLARRDRQRAVKRYATRSCVQCGARLRLVDDANDAALLQPGQLTEQRIGSVDYDVWQCTCGASRAEVWEVSDDASQCAACSFRTDRCIKREVLERATRSSTGLARHHYRCAHCNAERVDEVVLARTRSSHDTSRGGRSSGGGRSGGGGSFGGGRSGGGGSGGSY